MKKRYRLLILITAVIISSVFRFPVYAEDENIPEELAGLYAQSAVLMDADSGRVLFGREDSTIRPMASTTKIMTCILALEKMEDNQVVTASSNAAGQPKVKLGVQEGEEFYLKDLLYSLMLESHNDSAVVIAEGIAGSVGEFAAQMNEKAEEIGCGDTYFITPNGLDASDDGGTHSTTAKDLAAIMRYCIKQSPKKEEFLAITQTPSYSFGNVEGNRNFSCNNHNAFLTMMDGAISGKTGFTADAGYCYVGALENGGRTFIVALLACGWPNNKGYKWSDTKKLMEYGISHYKYRNVWQDIELKPVTVNGGIPDTGQLSGTASTEISMPEEEINILLHDSEEISVESDIKEELTAPVKKGDPAGTVKYTLDGEVIKEYQVVADRDVGVRTLAWCLGQILNDYTMQGRRQSSIN